MSEQVQDLSMDANGVRQSIMELTEQRGLDVDGKRLKRLVSSWLPDEDGAVAPIPPGDARLRRPNERTRMPQDDFSDLTPEDWEAINAIRNRKAPFTITLSREEADALYTFYVEGNRTMKAPAEEAMSRLEAFADPGCH